MLLPGAIVALGIVAALVATFLTYRAAMASAAKYEHHFMGYIATEREPVSFLFWLQGKYDPPYEAAATAELGHAVGLALDELARIWEMVALIKAINGVHIIVKATPDWTDGFGRHVGGEELPGDTIAVGSDLTALLHELAHLAERKLDGLEDATHAGWAAKGITLADVTFRQRLAAGRSA